MAPHHYLIHLWKSFGNMTLGSWELDELAMDALAKGGEDTSGLKVLELYTDLQISESYMKNIASVVARSELVKIDIQTADEEQRVHILGSIQWEHVRELVMRMKSGGSLDAVAMRALVGCAKKMPGGMELDGITIRPNSYGAALFMSHDELLATLLSSISFKRLLLYVVMTLEQMLSILRSLDLSQVWNLGLWAAGFDSTQVDTILDGIQHATEMQVIRLWHATVTNEQKERMKTMGINLSTDII
jgi:hypothetical protein